MSVEVQYVGRLGNHLFQYAFGRIVAEALGYELRCLPQSLPAKTSFFGETRDCGASATLPELASYFKGAPQWVPGKQVAAPEERYLVGCDGWDGHNLDFSRLVSDRRERRLVLRGFFQRFEYYRAHRDQLREWFALEPLGDPHGITRRDILVNLRRGWDYALAGWVLSLSAYKQLLREVPHDRVFVCGTGISAAVREALAELSPIYYRSTPIDEFRFIMKFDKIIQSNSTFCWWASFLSDATALYTPRPDRGYLAKELAGDALDTGEERYHLFDAKVAAFIPFQPNPEASVRLDESSLVIESPVAGVARIRCAPPLLRFYEWLVEQREPFGVDHLVERGFMTREQVEPVIGPLVETGAIVLEERFLEDAR